VRHNSDMVQTILQEQSVEIIDGTTVDVKARVITVTGKRGTLKRDFKHLNVDIKKTKIKGKDVIQVFGLYIELSTSHRLSDL
jgi:large subunit ribosomal protein L9e